MNGEASQPVSMSAKKLIIGAMTVQVVHIKENASKGTTENPL